MSIPEIGQIVEVRQRPWVVADVAVSAFTPDPRRGVSGQQPLVTLSSIEDDGLGEDLQVLWEMEPSRSIREQSGLPAPTGFDDPTELDCFLDAVSWGSVSSANLKALQAPFRSGIEMKDYQLDPVVRALSLPMVNLVIADDVASARPSRPGWSSRSCYYATVPEACSSSAHPHYRYDESAREMANISRR